MPSDAQLLRIAVVYEERAKRFISEAEDLMKIAKTYRAKANEKPTFDPEPQPHTSCQDYHDDHAAWLSRQ